METRKKMNSFQEKVLANRVLQCTILRKAHAWKSSPISTIHLFMLMFIFCGCTVAQQWSENYALLPGVRANDPAIIDGNLETVGYSQRKKTSGDANTDFNIPSEAIIFLTEKKAVYRIVIHSSNLEEFTLMALDSKGEWGKFYDRRSNKEPLLDLRLKQVIRTTGIKLVVRRTTEDAARKRKNVQFGRENVLTSDGKRRRGRYVYRITGATTALAKIAEIELYGYTSSE